MNPQLRNRILIFFAVLALALVFLFPTAKVLTKKFLGQEITAEDTTNIKWISKPISLGLDLSGGVHLVYRVEVEEAVTNKLQVTANSIRNSLRKEKVAVTRARLNKNDLIEISLLSSKLIDKAKDIILNDYKSLEFVNVETEGNRAKLIYQIKEADRQTIKETSVSQAIETLRARIDQFGVAEPILQKVGSERILLQMPGIQDIESVKSVVGRVAKLEFRLLPQAGSNVGKVTVKDKRGGTIQVEDIVQMGGDAVDNANVGFDPQGQIEVSLTLNTEGARTFANVTGNNVGRQLGIILDGELYSAPNINEKIAGGRCSITGGFDINEAKELAVVLRAGALPAPLTILEERTVGPTLGAESIRKGVNAILIGFGLILVFMIFYYKKSGVVAAVILALNIVFVLAALSAFGATLTLPGLAGLALTVGMAVDANVISYERIREEIRNGADRDAAVSSGFSKALSAILDSNITTLLAGFILFYFGSGPIRGFAVTLSIGVMTTIYCATFVARLAFDYFSLKNKQGLSI